MFDAESDSEQRDLREELARLRDQLQAITARLTTLEAALAAHGNATPSVEPDRALPDLPLPVVPLPALPTLSKASIDDLLQRAAQRPPPPPRPASAPILPTWLGESAAPLPTPPPVPLQPPDIGPHIAAPADDHDELRVAPAQSIPAPPLDGDFPFLQPPPTFAVQPTRPPAPRTVVPPVDWEAIIGGRWMTWIGAFVLLLALGFTVHWAYTTFHAPPWLQVLAFHLLGGGLLAGGYYLQRKGIPIAARALTGLGVFGLYATAFATLHLYQLWPESVAFVECSLITALAIALALGYNSPGVVVLGALGGYLTPIVTSTGSANYAGLFTYLAFLNVALVGCAVGKSWSFLKPLTLGATALMFALWLMSAHFPQGVAGAVWGTEWFVALHFAIFLLAGTIPPLLWKRTTGPLDGLTLVAGSFGFVGATWWLFHERPEQQLALVSWGMAALHAGLFALTHARVTIADPLPRIHLALAAAFFTLAIPLQIDNAAYWGATWAVEALIFMTVGAYFRDRQMQLTALVVAGIGAARLLRWDFFAPEHPLGASGLDLRFVMFMTAGLVLLFAAELNHLFDRLWGRDPDEHEVAITGRVLLNGVAAVLLTAAQPLQFGWTPALGIAWSVEALTFATLAAIFRNPQFTITGTLNFAIAGAWLLLREVGRFTPIGNWELGETAFQALLTVGLLAILAGQLPRIVGRLRQRAEKLDEFEAHHVAILGIIGAVLITVAMPLHYGNTATLGPAWAIEAIAFVAFGLLARDPQSQVSGLLVFALCGVQTLNYDFLAPSQLNEQGWDLRFLTTEFSVLLAFIAAGLTLVAPKYLHRPQSTLDLQSAGFLAGCANVIGLLGVLCQWNGHVALTVWVVDVAAIWAWGFIALRPAVRAYTFGLALLMVGGRALANGYAIPGEYQLVFNARFGTLALVAALYFAAGWFYRTLRQRGTAKTVRVDWAEVSLDESHLDQVLGSLANIVALIALSCEIRHYFTDAVAKGLSPFPDMHMAEMATYSIVWAIYAGIMVAFGFWLRYPLFRFAGLGAFGIILCKVFFVDLGHLRWMPRVLALAVLGVMLIGVSVLYQKFLVRVRDDNDAPPPDTG